MLNTPCYIMYQTLYSGICFFFLRNNFIDSEIIVKDEKLNTMKLNNFKK